MVAKRRWAARVAVLGLVMSPLFFFNNAQGQVRVLGKKMVAQPFDPAIGGGSTNPTLSSQLSAIKLVEKAQYRQYINVARDSIKDKEWDDALTALQKILDEKDDFYVQVREKDASGREMLRWTSVKFEANNLLGSMPDEGLDAYEVRFGGKSKAMLDKARETGDRELLAEVAIKYLHTRAGAEATELLATTFLDRGQFFMAALRFEKLLAMNPARTRINDLTLFKTALAYRRAGDTKKAEAAWKDFENKVRGVGGIKINDELVGLAKLHQLYEAQSVAVVANAHDWPVVGGNNRRSAQAIGSPPLLDTPLWSRLLIHDPEDDTGKVDEDTFKKEKSAKDRIDQAINLQGQNPVLPGFFPVAVNRLLIYRSYDDIRAVFLHDEKDNAGKVIAKAGSLAWRSTPFDGSLCNVTFEGRFRNPNEWLNQYFQPQFAGYANVVYENSLIGALSTDHRFVYGIDDLAVPANPQIFQYMWNSGQISNEVKPLVMNNCLYAFNVQSGKGEWRLGDFGGKDEVFKDSHFLGAPISVGGKLYALNEKNPGPMGDSDLRLIVIDPNKMSAPHRPTIVDVIAIGQVSQNSRITHDIPRRTNASHLAYGEGILVCPSHAGEVLGIDLLSRSLAWAYPYREQSSNKNNPFPNPGFPGGGFPGGMPFPGGPGMGMGFNNGPANWHNSPPVISDGKVVFTAPDALSVHCINLRDGTPVWKRRQNDNDLYLAGVYNSKVLVVGKNAIRAMSLDDGRQLWYLPTGDMPSGQGVAAKNIYYLPLRKGEILAVDIEKGQVKAHNRAAGATVPPGNLVFYDGAVLSQTPREVVAYPQLLARLDSASAALRDAPNNPLRLFERGELLLKDGQVQGAVDDLQKTLSLKPAADLVPKARLRLYEAMTDLLQIDFNGASARYLDEYRDLCKVPDNVTEQQLRQAKFFRIVGQGRESQGNLVDAFTMYKEFGSLPIHKEQGGVASLDDPTHKVPTNVWLRGRISAMIAKAAPQQREPLEQRIRQEWKVVEAKKDVDAIRGFVDMFDVPFAVGREARLHLAANLIAKGDKGNFLEAELALHQIRNPEYAKDADIGGRALATLALLEEKKGAAESMKLAAAYYRELQRDYADVAVRGKQTGADLFNDLATDPRFRPYLEEPGSLFNQTKIGAREIPAGNFTPGIQGFIFTPQGDLTPLMKQHRLVLEPANANNPELRLVDVTTNAVRWRTNLGMVQNNFQYFQYLYAQAGGGNTQYYPNARFRFFQVKGHLLVFQVGTMVYCLDSGSGKQLWQHALVDNLQNPFPGQPGMFVNQVLPDAEGNPQLVVINNFTGQRSQVPIGSVGAVEASYVALVTSKGLVVLDPLRGSVLWKKTDVSASTRCFGDEQYLLLVESPEPGSAGAGRTLRASDGQYVEVADFGNLYQNKVRTLGRRILAFVPGKAKSVLRLYDIAAAKDVWSREFEPGSTVLLTEEEEITGVVQPNGKVVVLETAGGKELLNAGLIHGRVTTEDLKNLKDPLLLRDAERYYIALSKGHDANKFASGFVANNFSNGLRCFPVNGWVVAFHRKPGERKVGDRTLTWKAGDFHWHSYKPLDNQMIILEQFAQMPVLLFSSRYNELIQGGAGGNRWSSNTQSINKHNGKMVWDPGFRQNNGAAHYFAFNLDLKGGTINLIGFGGTLQHYIDDGRKLSNDIPGGGELPPLQGGGAGGGSGIGPGGRIGFPGGGVMPIPPNGAPGAIELPIRRIQIQPREQK